MSVLVDNGDHVFTVRSIVLGCALTVYQVLQPGRLPQLPLPFDWQNPHAADCMLAACQQCGGQHLAPTDHDAELVVAAHCRHKADVLQ